MTRRVRPGFYNKEINQSAWVVPERYQNLKQVGAGAYGTVWWVKWNDRSWDLWCQMIGVTNKRSKFGRFARARAAPLPVGGEPRWSLPRFGGAGVAIRSTHTHTQKVQTLYSLKKCTSPAACNDPVFIHDPARRDARSLHWGWLIYLHLFVLANISCGGHLWLSWPQMTLADDDLSISDKFSSSWECFAYNSFFCPSACICQWLTLREVTKLLCFNCSTKTKLWSERDLCSWQAIRICRCLERKTLQLCNQTAWFFSYIVPFSDREVSKLHHFLICWAHLLHRSNT